MSAVEPEKTSPGIFDIAKLAITGVGFLLLGILVLIMFPIFLISATQIVIRIFLTAIKYARARIRGDAAV